MRPKPPPPIERLVEKTLSRMAAEDTAAKRPAAKAALPPSGTARKPAPGRTIWRKIVAALVVLYALSMVVVWLWMYLGGDRTTLATVFLFGPRWMCAVPLLLLVPAAAIWHRPMLWLLAITGVLILGPILGFEFHVATNKGQAALRVLTCNVNQYHVRADELADLIDRTRPDIVALQEVPGIPPPFFWPRGWYVVRRDELIVASRFPIVEHKGLPCPGIPGKLVAIRYTVELPDREVQLFNLHLFTPRPGLAAVLDSRKVIDFSKVPVMEEMLRGRADEARQVSDWIRQFPGPTIVVGDFNTPVESVIYRRYWSWLDNAFSEGGFGLGFTKVTEQHGFSYGARIDHILYTPPWRCLRAWVGPDVGSDHLPLLAEFE